MSIFERQHMTRGNCGYNITVTLKKTSRIVKNTVELNILVLQNGYNVYSLSLLMDQWI